MPCRGLSPPKTPIWDFERGFESGAESREQPETLKSPYRKP